MSVKLTQPQKEMIKVIQYDNYPKINKLKNKYNIAFQNVIIYNSGTYLGFPQEINNKFASYFVENKIPKGYYLVWYHDKLGVQKIIKLNGKTLMSLVNKNIIFEVNKNIYSTIIMKKVNV